MGLEKINELRKERGLTSEQLSKLSGVPKGTLDKILTGVTKDPKLETLKSIARVLDCTLDDFDDKPNLNKLDDINNKEIKEFAQLFLEVDDETKEYVIELMKKTLKK
ncbi:helix-turn-helix domain-containing protein [Clostridioides difficile]|uniref:helix-turn-helix domain-containing protein n=1 Tax=Clostridioides difficile TaxID=1496 RepID=UPI0013722EC7|nr:helix-turn-helix transcriptional regulator [Clostridioides difficile]NAS58245.1 XRE family transcriptional regulator [Clostridioides difficile]NAS81757.1 XRE family transcriptional regulator [Clostridioides difficile]NAT81226.1 XRE family transcriptional regulator [Clostridioides difficile]HBH4135394.1 helix-turn-helix transcriptional regulator [Clostridioides difficile]